MKKENKKRLYKVDPTIVKTGSNQICVWVEERLNQQTFELNLNIPQSIPITCNIAIVLTLI